MSLCAAEIDKIEEKTRDQAENEEWFLVRKYRITSSVAHNYWTAKQVTPNLYNTFQGVQLPSYLPSLRWGREQEPIARTRFLQHMLLTHQRPTIRKCGFTIHKQLQYIGATSDGYYTDACCDNPSLLEIKCPFRLKDKRLADVKMEFLDKNGKLRQSSRYFTQINVSLACSGLKQCYFVLYGPQDFHVELIEFDAEHFDKMKEKFGKIYGQLLTYKC